MCVHVHVVVGVQVRGLSKRMGRQLDTPNELWSFFVERTRANLHIVSLPALAYVYAHDCVHLCMHALVRPARLESARWVVQAMGSYGNPRTVVACRVRYCARVSREVTSVYPVPYWTESLFCFDISSLLWKARGTSLGLLTLSQCSRCMPEPSALDTLP